jgi:hypothetical protein
MWFARRAVYFTAPAALTLSLGCRPEPPSGPAGQLARFEGGIEGDQPLDSTRSDLDLWAARALEAGTGTCPVRRRLAEGEPGVTPGRPR